jgi:hypothetical protein
MGGISESQENSKRDSPCAMKNSSAIKLTRKNMTKFIGRILSKIKVQPRSSRDIGNFYDLRNGSPESDTPTTIDSSVGSSCKLSPRELTYISDASSTRSDSTFSGSTQSTFGLWNLVKNFFRISDNRIAPDDDYGSELDPLNNQRESGGTSTLAGTLSLNPTNSSPENLNGQLNRLPENIKKLFPDLDLCILEYCESTEELNGFCEQEEQPSIKSFVSFLIKVMEVPLYNPSVTTETQNNVGPHSKVSSLSNEDLENFRKDDFRNILTEISKNEGFKQFINTKEFIEDLIKTALNKNKVGCLMELVKILSSTGIDLFFDCCTTLLNEKKEKNTQTNEVNEKPVIQSSNLDQKKKSLQDALNKLLSRDSQMKLHWKTDNERPEEHNQDTANTPWNTFKKGCVQLSKNVYKKEYELAVKDIQNVIEKLEEPQLNLIEYQPKKEPDAFIFLTLIYEKKFEDIKKKINEIGQKSIENSSINEGLFLKNIYGDYNSKVLEALCDHFTQSP